MVTLVGSQGSVKTTAIEALAPLLESFVEIGLHGSDADLARLLRGKLVGELAELKGLRSKNAEWIKAWISRRFEEWTPKYEERNTRFARRCIFIGTTNEPEFLDDHTGERRHLPLEVDGGDVKAIARDRDQLWVEGAVLFRREGVCWRDAKNLAEGEHAAFKVTDPWYDDIAKYLASVEGDARVFTADVLQRALGIVPANMGKHDEMRVTGVLKALGFMKDRARIDGVPRKFWVRGLA
jgi:predicted P-loop ATPase